MILPAAVAVAAVWCPVSTASFYIGSVWCENALPARIKSDLDANTRTFVWMGVNLWRYARNMATYAPDPGLTQKYGFQLLNYSPENHPKVVYKDIEFEKDFWDHGLSRVEVLDSAKVKIQDLPRLSGQGMAPHPAKRKILVRYGHAHGLDKI